MQVTSEVVEQVIPRDDWHARRAAHEERVDRLLAGHRWRTTRGIKHPVEDFMFEYYSFRVHELRRWTPGAGITLVDPDGELAGLKLHWHRDGRTGLDLAEFVTRRGRSLRAASVLLSATARRTPQTGCFGMHEWAMVAGLDPAQTRHPQLGLRPDPQEIEQTLDSVGLRCTHIDAHRFFPEAWQRRNRYAPTRENQIDLDQPGCLHVGMDLYRIAHKLAPFFPAELVCDCFELAREIRVLDMRASPYDLSSLDVDGSLTPVRVETPEGRSEYASAQRGFADRAQRLRWTLLGRLEVLEPTA